MQFLAPFAVFLASSIGFYVSTPSDEHTKAMDYIKKTIRNMSTYAPPIRESWMFSRVKTLANNLASAAQNGVKAVATMASDFMPRRADKGSDSAKVKPGIKRLAPTPEEADGAEGSESDHEDCSTCDSSYTSAAALQLDGSSATAADAVLEALTSLPISTAATSTPSLTAAPETTTTSAAISAILSGSSLSTVLDAPSTLSQTPLQTPLQTPQIASVQSCVPETPGRTLSNVQPRTVPPVEEVPGPSLQLTQYFTLVDLFAVLLSLFIVTYLYRGYRDIVEARALETGDTILTGSADSDDRSDNTTAGAVQDARDVPLTCVSRCGDGDLLPASSPVRAPPLLLSSASSGSCISSGSSSSSGSFASSSELGGSTMSPGSSRASLVSKEAPAIPAPVPTTPTTPTTLTIPATLATPATSTVSMTSAALANCHGDIYFKFPTAMPTAKEVGMYLEEVYIDTLDLYAEGYLQRPADVLTCLKTSPTPLDLEGTVAAHVTAYITIDAGED